MEINPNSEAEVVKVILTQVVQQEKKNLIFILKILKSKAEAV